MKAKFAVPKSEKKEKIATPVVAKQSLLKTVKLDDDPPTKVSQPERPLLASRRVQNPTEKKPHSKRKTTILGIGIGVLIFLVFVIVISGGVFLYTRKNIQQQSSALKAPKAISSALPAANNKMTPAEMSDVLSKAGKLTLLPTESPIMAKIVDAKFLATQSEFYKNAQDGDVLLVYPTSQKAYIYSAKRNLIVNSGPVIADSPSPSPKK